MADTDRQSGIIDSASQMAADALEAAQGFWNSLGASNQTITVPEQANEYPTPVNAAAVNNPLVNQQTATPIPQADLTSPLPAASQPVPMRELSQAEQALNDYQGALSFTTKENTELKAVMYGQQDYDSDITPYQEAYAKAQQDIKALYENEQRELLKRQEEIKQENAKYFSANGDIKGATEGLREKKQGIEESIDALEDARGEALVHMDADSKYLVGKLIDYTGDEKFTSERLAFLLREENAETFGKYFKDMESKLKGDEAQQFNEIYTRHQLTDQDTFTSRSDALIGQHDSTSQQIGAMGAELEAMHRSERQIARTIVEKENEYQQSFKELDQRFWNNTDTYDQYKLLAEEITNRDDWSTEDKIAAKERLAGVVAFADSDVQLQQKAQELLPDLDFKSTSIKSITAAKVFNVYVDDKSGALMMKEANSSRAEAVEITGHNVHLQGAGKDDRVVVQFNEGVTDYVKNNFNGQKLNFMNDDGYNLDFAAPGMTYDTPAFHYVRDEGARRPHKEIHRENGAMVMKTLLNYGADKYENPADIVNADSLSDRNKETLAKRGQAAEMRYEEKYQKNMYHVDKSLAHGAQRLDAIKGARASFAVGPDRADDLLAQRDAEVGGKPDKLAELARIKAGAPNTGITGGEEVATNTRGLNFRSGIDGVGAAQSKASPEVRTV